MRVRIIIKLIGFTMVTVFTGNAVHAENLILENQTVSMYGDHTYEIVRLTNSTINVTLYTGFDDGRGFLRIYADSILIDENSEINADGAGGMYDSSFAGNGGRTGYGGAGYGGYGGDGGENSGSGGYAYGSNAILNLGSRGATNNPVQVEGSGGGAILLDANYILINGEVTADGKAGINGSQQDGSQSGGKGGGSGGHIQILSNALYISGEISVTGGRGGDAAYNNNVTINPDGGGGGSGGRIYILTNSIVDNTAIFVIEGGQGGAGHIAYGGVNGFYGEEGEIQIVIIPNWIISTTHPEASLSYINPVPTFVLNAGANIYGYFYEVDQDSLSGADLTSNFTQQDTLNPGTFVDGTWYFHCLPMDSNYQTVDSLASSFQFKIRTVPPDIVSPSHPNQNYFYANTNPSFTFEQIAGISEFYFIFDQNPYTIPDSLLGTHHSSNTLIIPGVSEGSHWLHLVGMDNVHYIGQTASHFRVNVGPPQPIISFSSDSLQYGLVTIGQTSNMNLTIYNLGNGGLVIDTLLLTDTMHFSINPSLITGNILPGDSVVLEITFQPQDTLLHVDSLTITANDPTNPNSHIVVTGQGSTEPTQYIYLDVPILDVLPNDTFLIPINVQFPLNTSFSSAELKISGYLGSLILIGVELDSSLMGDAGWLCQYNETDSLLITAFAGADNISGSGVLLRLRFSTTAGASGFVPVTLDWGKFDTGTIATALTSGGVNILTPVYGDVDMNGLVEAYDASLILKYLVGYISLDEHQRLNANVSLDNTVSALDAALILQYVVSILDSLPYDSADGSFYAFGNITMEDVWVLPNENVCVPLYLSGCDNILAFRAKLTFNPDELDFEEVVWLELFNDFITEVHSDQGTIMIAGAGTLPENQEGVFTSLCFTTGPNFIETTVHLDEIRWNEEVVQENVADARLSRELSLFPDGSNLPLTFGLSQNHPNPFNPKTIIRYDLPENCHVSLIIYNTLGQIVKTMISQDQKAGYHLAIWDGINDSGQPAGAGFYIYQIRAGNFEQTRKMILLR